MTEEISCKFSPDSFCFVCGTFMARDSRKYRIEDSPTMKEAYDAYFGIPIPRRRQPWCPQFFCEYCRKTLTAWYTGEDYRALKFSVPRIWRRPSNHVDDCFFCTFQGPKLGRPRRSTEDDFDTRSTPSSAAPVLRGEEDPVPQPPTRPVPKKPKLTLSQASGTSESSNSQGTSSGPNSQGFVSGPEAGPSNPRPPHFPTQEDMNDLIRDLNLGKSSAELLVSRLKEWNLVDQSVKVTTQRGRHELFSHLFTFYENVCFCHDIKGLFEALNLSYEPAEWRLFLDGSSQSFKAVLLHNGNELPTIPLLHSANLKESYENVELVLDLLHYEENQWEVIGDFKIIAFLMGLQGGYTKFPCHLCLFNSRADNDHYTQKTWPTRENFVEGVDNVLAKPLIDPKKVLMPPLHIKLGLIKQFVKALNPTSEAFEYLRSLFPALSEAQVKAGIFVGPQIRKLMKDTEFAGKLSEKEGAAWDSFVAVVDGFLGNHKAENYVQLVEDLVKTFGEMGCRMSQKVHMLHSHLDVFKENMGAYSEEQGERFHQDVKDFERRYVGQYNETMMGDYIWQLVRDTDFEHRRKSRRTVHF